MGIWSQTGATELGKRAKTIAITTPNIAMTISSAKNTIAKKIKRTRLFIYFAAISDMLLPWFRIETTNAPKSWAAPMKIQPSVKME